MLIQSTHEILDKEGFRWAIDNAPSLPEFRIQYFTVTKDHTHVTGLWVAPSCEALSGFLDPLIGGAAVNRYFELDEELSKGCLPACKPVDAKRAHAYGKYLVRQGMKREAFGVFQFNADHNPDVWFVTAGLARGYSVVGDFENAIQQMKEAMERAPSDRKARLAGMLARLEAGLELH